MQEDLERAACTPLQVEREAFNSNAILPHGLDVEHVYLAMSDFVDFLGFINTQLHTRDIIRIESMLMPANFSSIVGEFIISAIPKHCPSLVKNRYHNGHPDLILAGRFPQDSVQHANEGIEVKASRYMRGWQGHNPEDTWLMVFMFESSRPRDFGEGVLPRPFKFLQVLGARLEQSDWLFSGRSATSRRTITASVTTSGYQKMVDNWVYKAPDL